MRLGPQGAEEPSRAPFYESPELNIPAASYGGIACRQASSKVFTFSMTGPTAVARDRRFESVSLQRRVNKLSVPQRQPGSVGRLAAAVLWPDRLQPSRRICAIATPGPDVGEK